ncbi:hypothetical protein [Rhizobium leguminosarum]
MNPLEKRSLAMKFVELAGQDGKPPQSVSVVGMTFDPLDYDELAAARLHQPLSVQLNWRHARIIDTNIEGFDINGLARGNATLESTHSSAAVSLQRGGWLPPGLAIADGDLTILPDRNVISLIKGRYDNGSLVGVDKDFLDLLTEHEVRINPLLYAIEGNGRKIPDHRLVKEQMEEAIAFLRKALPKAVLVIGDRSLEGVLGLIEDTRAGFENKRKFLIHLAPLLSAPIGRRLFASRWKNVLEAADRHGLARDSLVVLAALSSVAVPNSGSAAKKVLKFTHGYSDQDVYNALADFRSLEILIHLITLFPHDRPAIFTADKALALFWAGIRADNFRQENLRVFCDLTPVEQLFPHETIDLWKRDSRPRPV